MPALAYVLISLEAIAMILYLTFYFRAGTRITLLLKTLTSGCFLALGILALFYAADAKFAATVLLGLFCGLVGDIVLGLRRLYRNPKKEFFLSGLFMFFLGHVLYMIAFSKFSTLNIHVFLISAAVLTIFMVIIMDLSGVNFGSTRPAVIIYTLISALLLSVTVVNVIAVFTMVNLLLVLGALLFVTSDFLLSFLYFKKMNTVSMRVLKILNIAAYYAGQTLFALSIFLA
ncbi:MAG TPA: hypothetical protein DD618_03660 [Acholeplasmatales bacterium]|nr:hypothetical protein [Acholeplasmatales bacterium]